MNNEKNKNEMKDTETKQKIEVSPFSLTSSSATISLQYDAIGNPINSKAQMRVDADSSRVRTVWKETTEKDILLIGYDLKTVNLLESNGMDISSAPLVSVVVPLNAMNGELRDLVKNKELVNIEFINFQAKPAIKKSGDYSSLYITFASADVKEIN